MKKLHLGCGSRYLPNYIHIDIKDDSHIDYVHDIGSISELFDKDSIDEIYVCHVLEHFNRKKVWSVFKDWWNVLKPNGILRIAVPDFSAIVNQYVKTGDLKDVMGLLYGGQRDEYDYHFFTYDYKLINQLLVETGFSNVSRYDWKTFLPEGFDDYSRSYIPHLDETGMLMSLNVEARKNVNTKFLEPSDDIKKIMKW